MFSSLALIVSFVGPQAAPRVPAAAPLTLIHRCDFSRRIAGRFMIAAPDPARTTWLTASSPGRGGGRRLASSSGNSRPDGAPPYAPRRDPFAGLLSHDVLPVSTTLARGPAAKKVPLSAAVRFDVSPDEAITRVEPRVIRVHDTSCLSPRDPRGPPLRTL